MQLAKEYQRKIYIEDPQVFEYIKKNVPKQEDSKWIRAATRAKMESELKKISKKSDGRTK